MKEILNMKGAMTTEQIAYIIIAILVLALLIFGFVYFGYRPFQNTTGQVKCTDITLRFCCAQVNSEKCWRDSGCEEPMPTCP